MNEKLVAFMYLLLRDHMPVGEVIELIKEIPDINQDVIYTNKILESLAEDLVNRILEA